MKRVLVLIALFGSGACKTSSPPAKQADVVDASVPDRDASERDAESAPPDATPGDEQTPPDPNRPTVQVRYMNGDGIVSENGQLSLEEGEFFLESLTLIEDETGAEVPWLEAVRFDLAATKQQISARTVRPGVYTWMRVAFRHADPSVPTFSAKITDADGATVLVEYLGAAIPQGILPIYPAESIEVSEQSGQPTLTINLRGLFFYLWPITDAEQGVWRVREGGLRAAQMTTDMSQTLDVHMP